MVPGPGPDGTIEWAIAADLDATVGALQWTVNAYTLALAALILLAGDLRGVVISVLVADDHPVVRAGLTATRRLASCRVCAD